MKKQDLVKLIHEVLSEVSPSHSTGLRNKMTVRELKESIRTEIRRQLNGRSQVSEVLHRRSIGGMDYVIYYEFYDHISDDSVKTRRARFGSGRNGCQDFRDWWSEEFLNVTGYEDFNPREFADTVFRTSNGVMACASPHGAFAIAIPAKLAMQMEAPTSIIGGDDDYLDAIARIAGVSTDEIEEVRVQPSY